MNAAEFRSLMYRYDPYEGFNSELYLAENSVSAERSQSLETSVQRCRPESILVVGAWRGGLTLQLCEIISKAGIAAQIVTLDTWLGSEADWLDASANQELRLQHGYPTVYYQFLSTVCRRGFQELVTPLPLPASQASRLLVATDVKADMIYISAPQTPAETWEILRSYWQIVRPGGVLLGNYVRDDRHLALVQAVQNFAAEKQIPLSISNDQWLLTKPVYGLPRELVVAHYQEDISWLGQVSWPFSLYSKGDGPGIALPNVGREAHTYLHHIVSRYNSLSEYTAFCQGNPFAHAPKLLEKLDSFEEGSYTILGSGILTCDGSGAPHHPGLDLSGLWREILPEIACPDPFEFGPGAQFIVHADRIRIHPVGFYQHLLDLVVDRAIGPWECERLWSHIFSV